MRTKAIPGIVLTLLLASMVGFIAPVNAISVIDQQQTEVDLTVVLAIGGSSEQKLAQVITAGLNGLLTEVGFHLGEYSGDLIVEIQGVTAEGKPNGVVLTSETMPFGTLPKTLPNDPPFERIVFSSPISISAGEQIAVVLRSTGSHTVLRGPIGDPYVGGDAFFDARPNPPGEWLPISTGTDVHDLAFQTLVREHGRPTLPPMLRGTRFDLLQLHSAGITTWELPADEPFYVAHGSSWLWSLYTQEEKRMILDDSLTGFELSIEGVPQRLRRWLYFDSFEFENEHYTKLNKYFYIQFGANEFEAGSQLGFQGRWYSWEGADVTWAVTVTFT